MIDEEAKLRAELQAMTTRALMAEAQNEVLQQLLLKSYRTTSMELELKAYEFPTCEVCGEQSYCMGQYCLYHCNEENRPVGN